MRTQTATLIAAALLVLSGCSGSDQVETTTTSAATTTVADATTTTQSDREPTAEMSDAVGAAARALLNVPGMRATRLIYDENGGLATTFWLDWRANGDLALLVVTDAQIGGLAQVGERLLSAASSDTRSEPWTAEEPPLPAGDPGVAINFDLAALAGGGLAAELAEIPRHELEVESGPTSDGGTRWIVRFPFGDATATREWTIDADGRLRSYLLTSDSAGPIFGAFATAEFRFDPLTDPPPISLPTAGTDLDTAAFDLPENLPLPGQ
jgi:hypothetical protein